MSKILFVILMAMPLFASANALPDYSKVVSAVTLDLDGDAGFDRAVLIDDENGSTDLYIYASKFDESTKQYLPMSLQLVRKGIAFMGGMWGQVPRLMVNNTNGRLLIESGNDSIGRSRWVQSLEVTFDKGLNTYVVSGLQYMIRDTLDLDAGGNCEIDFLKGEAKRNGSTVQYSPQLTTLAAWDNDKLPSVCIFQ